MAIRDALIVSLVGMGVVFSGLLLTSFLISAISLVPAWISRSRQAPPPPAPAPAPREALPLAVTPVPPPDTAAVIAALLEVEMRLHGVDRPARFTFRRDPAAPDWRGDAGKRSGQPIKGVR
ncbi:MAG: OadG family protein [Acidobacteria bacterium]|nr:OadG family protein [Acidobacteriota bacterium]